MISLKILIQFFALFGLDLSFVFIPVILSSSSIRKKFRVDKDQLQNLREKLINLRYERAYQIILSLSIDEELLNRLKRFSNSLIMNPIIIDEIKTKLIKFDIPYSDDASLADIFTFAARGLNPRDLYIIDKALIEVMKLLKNFGAKKQYFELRDSSIGKDILDKIKSGYDPSLLGKKFYESVDWVIVYTLFYSKKNKHDSLLYYLINENNVMRSIIE